MSVGLQEKSSNLNSPSFQQAVLVWIKVALLSFGGPAGQIAVMHRILVEEKRWISESRFLHALNYCMLLPGPEAQQLATYIGWLLHRTAGGLVAGILFVLPGFISILILSILYAFYRDLGVVDALFFGLKAAVLAIVVEAVFRIGRRVLINNIMILLAAGAFVGIFFLQIPFPLLILAAGIIGLAGGRWRPDLFYIIRGHTAADDPITLPEHAARDAGWRRALMVSLIWLTLWAAPIVLLQLTLPAEHVLMQEAIFFSKAAVVTFGGAYSVLAYIAQQAVETYHWLLPGEMLDGLGMAETKPGPLIQVVQFVGFMGAFRNPAPFDPMTAAILGSLITTWVTFVPCFLWIFLGAPYIERLRGNRLLSSALSAITAAVVGVVLNLAVWFALHVLFASINESTVYGIRLMVPDIQSLDPASFLIAAAAFIMLFKFKLGMLKTLLLTALAGFIYKISIG
jgi:chromate transporter